MTLHSHSTRLSIASPVKRYLGPWQTGVEPVPEGFQVTSSAGDRKRVGHDQAKRTPPRE